jgi:glycosyltransferase 2 family protein
MKKYILLFLKTVFPLALGVYLIVYFFKSMSDESVQQFYKAIKEANYFWILLSLFIGWIALISRAQRWKYVLEPMGHETPLWHRYHAIMIGYLINLTIPRAGEASRAAMLYRSDKVPFAKSFGTIVAERAVDFLMLAIIGLITAYIGGSDFDKIWDQLIQKFGGKGSDNGGFSFQYILLGLITFGGLVLGYFYITNAGFKEKINGFVKGLMGGLLSIFKSKNPGGYLFHTFVIWICYVFMFALPFLALEETADFPIKGLLIGFIAGSLGITFTNGGIGIYPLLVGLVISFYLAKDHPENAEGIGNAMGMLIWVAQTIMMIVLGLISLIMLPKNYSKANESTGENTK